MRPKRLSILGVGLLGGSIGLSARSSLKPYKIVGYGHRQSTLQQAVQCGAVDQITTDLRQAVEKADWVILCTPVGLFGSILQQIGPNLADGAIVTDVGSTKRSIVRQAEQH